MQFFLQCICFSRKKEEIQKEEEKPKEEQKPEEEEPKEKPTEQTTLLGYSSGSFSSLLFSDEVFVVDVSVSVMVVSESLLSLVVAVLSPQAHKLNTIIKHNAKHNNLLFLIAVPSM